MSLSTFAPELVTETLHGMRVIDPFRWLEERNSEKTNSWIEEQKLSHDAYFARTSELEAIQSRVISHLKVDAIDQLVRLNDLLFYRRRRKDQEQGCICIRDATTDQERILVDPSTRGKFASVAIHRIADDGTLLAYELKYGGSDYKEIHIVEVETGDLLPDGLPAGYARGFVFAPGHSGFYYSHDAVSVGHEHTIRFHRFGANCEDTILFRRPRNPRSRLLLSADALHLGATYMREESGTLRIDLHIARYDRQPRWSKVFAGMHAPHWPLLHSGRIFVWTEDGAPNGRLIELSLRGSTLRVVIPETEAAMQQVARAAGYFIVSYLVERKSTIRSWTLDGVPMGEVLPPTKCTVQLLPTPGNCVRSVFFSHETFTTPQQIYEYQLGTKATNIISGSPGFTSLDDLSVVEVSYRSSDGTQIPMSLVMRRDLKPANIHCALLTSYGGFGVTMTAQFSVLVAVLVEYGVIFALPSIRGGGDFGKAWHESGRRRRRQTAIDDFLAAAEWIANWNALSRRRLGIFGGSNSGLLVAAAMVQRPDLFKAVVCVGPLLDMVRYECFDRACKWREEYGTVADAEDFAALYGYSPYHHIREGVNHPATLFVTGDCDDRCNPAHVRKTAARLQSLSSQINPILVDYSAARGHSGALPLSVRVTALSRRIAFLARELGLPVSPRGWDETINS